ncbi:MAG: CHASE4 domain-containing protein, partial [Croceibacterium sp.]
MLDRFGKLWRYVVAPTLAAMGILALILGSFLHLSTRRSDGLALDRQKHLVNVAVEQSEAAIVNDQEGSTLWDDAVVRLRQRPLDLDWIDNNLGIWFFTHYGHDEVYILSPQGEPVYAMHAGTRVPSASFAKVASPIRPLVRQLRGKLRGGYVAPEGSASLTVGALDRMVVAGRPAIVSVKPVVSETGNIPQAAGSEYVHIVVRYLDGSFLTGLVKEFGVDGASFVSRSSGSASVAVAGAGGIPIG